MENIEKELGRFLLHIKPVKNNLEYIINIIMLKDELCKLLKAAENKLKADFSTDLFINYINLNKDKKVTLFCVNDFYIEK